MRDPNGPRPIFLDPALNYISVDNFEGLTPNEMHGLINFPFNKAQSPMILAQDLPSELIVNTPIHKKIIKYLSMVRELSPLKLTQRGNLTVSFCKELLKAGVVEAETGLLNKFDLRTMEDSYFITYMFQLTQEAGLTMTGRGKLSLTDKGASCLDRLRPFELYRHLFIKHCTRFNWAYSDRLAESGIIQQSFGFSILLVQRHGIEERRHLFYVQRFLKAFPEVLNDFLRSSNPGWAFEGVYTNRVIERTLERFGLIKMWTENRKDGRGSLKDRLMIRKTELADKFVKWKTVGPHLRPEDKGKFFEVGSGVQPSS